jgi:hypothetical protein
VSQLDDFTDVGKPHGATTFDDVGRAHPWCAGCDVYGINGRPGSGSQRPRARSGRAGDVEAGAGALDGVGRVEVVGVGA